MRPDMAWELPDHTERIQSPVQRQLEGESMWVFSSPRYAGSSQRQIGAGAQHAAAGGEAKQAMMLALEQSKDCSSCSCSERLLLMVWHAADAAVHQGGCHAHLHHQHFQPAVPAHRPGHNQQHWQLSSQSIHNIVTLTDVANSIIASMAAMTCSSF